MPNKTSYLQLSKPLLTEAADIAVLNENFDSIDEEFIKINGRSHKRMAYIESSQNWTVPDHVTEIDVFLINGGYDGEDGEVAESNSSLDIDNANGGNGGDGGGCLYYPGLEVTSGETFAIVVGAANGGISSFGGLNSENLQGATGGEGDADGGGSFVDGYPSETMIDSKKGRLATVNNTWFNSRCPLDGKYYGVSGGAGATCSHSNNVQGAGASAGGVAGKNNADHRPGCGMRYSKGLYTGWSSGGGASYDEDGEANVSATEGGDGGNATTYGCGGGGGGAASRNGTAGLGGSGAPGAVIIAY